MVRKFEKYNRLFFLGLRSQFNIFRDKLCVKHQTTYRVPTYHFFQNMTDVKSSTSSTTSCLTDQFHVAYMCSDCHISQN